MLVELVIIPVGGDTKMSDEVAEALKIIDTSGLPYQLTPTGTCIEGTWDEVMRVIHMAHHRVRKVCPHVVTMIHIEDEEGAVDKLRTNVDSVEQKLNRPLERGREREVA